MTETNIRLGYIIQNICIFSVVWYKSGVWWHGLIGTLLIALIGGAVNGIYIAIRTKIAGYQTTETYPNAFYMCALVLAYYYFLY
jgi:hypothetical protein|tara:strand:+ start:502 stop:753 length:252 start_codon:yes stop_codon:yes gene_type:complete